MLRLDLARMSQNEVAAGHQGADDSRIKALSLLSNKVAVSFYSVFLWANPVL